MTDDASLLFEGLRIVNRNKRYVFWFWVLNLTLAEFATAGFRSRLHNALDHSLLAERLLHGFDSAVYSEMVTRPQWGANSSLPAAYFAFLFFLATLLLIPGVLEGYATVGRLSREDFFRACGRNLWRFVRLFLFFAIIAGPTAGILFGFHHVLVKAAEKSTNEKLGFYTIVATLTLIFLVMTAIRAWFDLAQVDVVVRDQFAVRKSVAAGLKHLQSNFFRLVGTYAVIAIVGVLVLVVGILLWHGVAPANVLGAFLAGQFTAILALWMRFWQRACAAALHLRLAEAAVPVSAPWPVAAVAPPSTTPPSTPPQTPPSLPPTTNAAPAT